MLCLRNWGWFLYCYLRVLVSWDWRQIIWSEKFILWMSMAGASVRTSPRPVCLYFSLERQCSESFDATRRPHRADPHQHCHNLACLASLLSPDAIFLCRLTACDCSFKIRLGIILRAFDYRKRGASKMLPKKLFLSSTTYEWADIVI